MYIATTTVIVIIQLLGACTIDFINKIVPWTSIISTNSIEFLFPSIFFLVALKRFDGLKEAGSFSVTLKKAIAIFNIVLGTALFIIHFI